MSVKISEKLIPASLRGDTFIGSLIMVDVTKEITSMIWNDYGVTANVNPNLKEGYTMKERILSGRRTSGDTITGWIQER